MWRQIKVKRDIYWIILLLCLMLVKGVACAPRVEHVWLDLADQQEEGTLLQVGEILSGDTIRLQDGRIVKYLGIQAPQTGEPFFEKSKQANAYLLRSGKVRLLFDRVEKDEEGNLLAYVHSPSMGVYCFVNEELLQYGFAKVSNLPHRYLREFQIREEIARYNREGIWTLEGVSILQK